MRAVRTFWMCVIKYYQSVNIGITNTPTETINAIRMFRELPVLFSVLLFNLFIWIKRLCIYYCTPQKRFNSKTVECVSFTFFSLPNQLYRFVMIMTDTRQCEQWTMNMLCVSIHKNQFFVFIFRDQLHNAQTHTHTHHLIDNEWPKLWHHKLCVCMQFSHTKSNIRHEHCFLFSSLLSFNIQFFCFVFLWNKSSAAFIHLCVKCHSVRMTCHWCYKIWCIDMNILTISIMLLCGLHGVNWPWKQERERERKSAGILAGGIIRRERESARRGRNIMLVMPNNLKNKKKLMMFVFSVRQQRLISTQMVHII